MLHSKIGEQMIIPPDPATDPQVRQVPLTHPAQLPRTADPLDRGEHPQCHQDSRVDRIPPDSALDRLDPGIQPLQIERLNIPPDDPHSMIRRNQLVQRHRPPLDLLPLRPLHPSPTRRSGARRNGWKNWTARSGQRECHLQFCVHHPVLAPQAFFARLNLKKSRTRRVRCLWIIGTSATRRRPARRSVRSPGGRNGPSRR